jgi:hypothetical protein
LKNSETDSDSDDCKLSDDVLAMVREVTEHKKALDEAEGESVAEDWSVSSCVQ